MPYEYLQMMFLALCPPLFWYVINPIVDSITDAKNGVQNKTRWNQEMEFTDDDIKRNRAAQVYFFAIFVFYTCCAFLWSPVDFLENIPKIY